MCLHASCCSAAYLAMVTSLLANTRMILGELEHEVYLTAEAADVLWGGGSLKQY